MSLQRTQLRARKRDPRDLDGDYLATKKFSKGKRGKKQLRQAIAASTRMARKPKFTPKKFEKQVIALSAKARFIVGLLIRATGQHADLVIEVITGRDPYHQRIFERGTTISATGVRV